VATEASIGGDGDNEATAVHTHAVTSNHCSLLLALPQRSTLFPLLLLTVTVYCVR
jgi:hypothetical protein